MKLTLPSTVSVTSQAIAVGFNKMVEVGHFSLCTAIISAGRIVRLFVNGAEVYRHPKYKVPEIEIKEPEAAATPRLWKAYVNGSPDYHAGFTTLAKAERWRKFIRGERMGK